MHLKSIDIHGFKSFADATALSFLPPKDGKYSITAIVGPNGSGKSNIVDAIRWVMGEQRMTQLRGKKGPDIIFAGSEGRGPLSMASVSIVLDNRDGQAQIEYEELAIARRLYRSGESEYLVNGNPVRLFDLQLLLAKAQFAQGSYSVVGQGMIDRLLLQNPEERKHFFDEAVGIKEFQIKRHQAVLKLTRSQEHMREAGLLLDEISPRLKLLSRQVKKLEQRHDVEQRLREQQEAYYVTLWRHHEERLKTLADDLEKIEARYRRTHAELSRIQDELALLAREASRQDQFAVLERTYQELSRKKNALAQESAVLAGRLQIAYSEAGKQNVAWLKNKISALTASGEGITKDAAAIEKDIARLRDEIRGRKQEADQEQILRTELRGSLARLEQRAAEDRHERSYSQFIGLAAVEEVLRRRESFGGVYGIVAQLARVGDRYRLAMDVAASAHLASLVVKDDRIAEACIRFLREEALGIATFLPLNKIKPRILSQDISSLKAHRGVCGLAAELIEFDTRFSDIFSYVFGDTLIVEDVETVRAIGIGRIRMVTLDGDVFERSGSIKGGFRKRREHGLSFSDNRVPVWGDHGDAEQEMKEIRSRLEQSEIAYEKKQEAMRSRDAALQVMIGKALGIRAKQQEIDAERAGFEQELSLQTLAPEAWSDAMKEVTAQKQSVEDGAASLQKELDAIQKKMERFNEEEEKKKQRIFALQADMQTLQESLNAILDEKNAEDIEIARVETREEDTSQEAYQELRESIENIAARGIAPLSPDDIPHVQEDIQKLKYTLSLIGGIDEEVQAEHQETKSRHDLLSAQLNDLEKTSDDLETLIAELDDVMKKKYEHSFRQIKKEFSRYFRILFDGGKADLKEVYADDPVDFSTEGSENDSEDAMNAIKEKENTEEDEKKISARKKRKKILAGIEVEAVPPGKKIKELQALSGGEKTLTSLALICAILHTNPAPFVFLDEVEAALDEANSVRLTQIIEELSHQSQFVLITHNRATMHAADTLYGVTMGAEGVSKLVSVSLAGTVAGGVSLT